MSDCCSLPSYNCSVKLKEISTLTYWMKLWVPTPSPVTIAFLVVATKICLYTGFVCPAVLAVLSSAISVADACFCLVYVVYLITGGPHNVHLSDGT